MNSRFLPRRWFVHWSVALVCVMVTWCSTSAQAADKEAKQPRTVAFLGMQLQNDNAGLEPTTDEERAREQKVSDLFKKELEASGRLEFITVPPTMSAKIEASQNTGECHGCEVDYGHQLGADLISWIKIQKVSNLILNLNVYMADVSAKQMTFVHSVDIRGNTRESWTRSLTYLVNNYVLRK